MSPTRGTCADFKLGLWLSANSVGNMTQPSCYKRTESNLLEDKNVLLGNFWIKNHNNTRLSVFGSLKD